MITLTKREHRKMVGSAEATLMAKAHSVKCKLRNGEDFEDMITSLSVAYSSLIALEHYDTGRYDPAEYFNTVTPIEASSIYSSSNTINTKK